MRRSTAICDLQMTHASEHTGSVKSVWLHGPCFFRGAVQRGILFRIRCWKTERIASCSSVVQRIFRRERIFCELQASAEVVRAVCPTLQGDSAFPADLQCNQPWSENVFLASSVRAVDSAKLIFCVMAIVERDAPLRRFRRPASGRSVCSPEFRGAVVVRIERWQKNHEV